MNLCFFSLLGAESVFQINADISPIGVPGKKKRKMETEKSPEILHGTIVPNRKRCRKNSHLVNHCPTSEGVSEVSKQANE